MELEEDIEIIWVGIKTKNKPLTIGPAFYGAEEKMKEETTKRIYSELLNQTHDTNKDDRQKSF